jgi:hypothetical protein
VRFNAAATPQAVQAVLRRVGFRSLGNDPVAGERTVQATVTDGDGGGSDPIENIVRVRAVSDAPNIQLSGTTTYVENQPPRVLSPTARLSDPDSAHFGGGTLRVSIALNAQARDRLAIRSQGDGAGQISVFQNGVKFQGLVIGTFSGGAGATPLRVTLNSRATIAAAQALLRSITFASEGSNPVPGERAIEFVLTERDGVASNVATRRVHVIRAEGG